MSELSALRIEIQRQCALGTGTFSIDDGYGATGLWQVSADLDAVGLRKAFAADAAPKLHPAPSPSEVGPEVVLSAEQAEMLRRVLTIAARQSDEAAKLLALLPEPVDADRTAAIDLLDTFGDAMPDAVSLATAAIKRGRALAVGDGV